PRERGAIVVPVNGAADGQARAPGFRGLCRTTRFRPPLAPPPAEGPGAARLSRPPARATAFPGSAGRPPLGRHRRRPGAAEPPAPRPPPPPPAAEAAPANPAGRP